MAARTHHRSPLERLLRFEPCPQCTYDLATGEGQRACHYFECPYLPEELDVRCPSCFYNFMTRDTTPGCGDPPSCEFATATAPQRVEYLTSWLAHHQPATDAQKATDRTGGRR